MRAARRLLQLLHFTITEIERGQTSVADSSDFPALTTRR